MKFAVVFAALLALPIVATAQDKPPAKASSKAAAKDAAKDAVATVNGVPVSSAQMEFLMQQQRSRGAPDNEQTRRMLRDELVNRLVVMQEAQRAGLAKTPEVQTQLDIARQEILVGAYLRDWVRKHPVSDAEVEREYERAKAQSGDKEYRARHILVEDEAQAKALIADLKKGANFAELATKNSKDTGSKERGGDLDWNAPANFVKPFSDAMVGLQKGKFTTTPVQTQFGWHVIQLDDIREAKVPPYEEVKPQLAQRMQGQVVEQYLKDLRAKNGL